MESRGNKNLQKDGVNIGTEQFGSTLHFGVDYVINGMQYAHLEKNDPSGFNNYFHTYSVEWTPECSFSLWMEIPLEKWWFRKVDFGSWDNLNLIMEKEWLIHGEIMRKMLHLTKISTWF